MTIAECVISNRVLRRRATLASISVATTLVVAKFLAYMVTGSIAMMTSAFDSAFDLLASVVTAFGVSRAGRPPDREHRFGHGKAEPLAALAQSLFVLGSSLFLVYEAAKRFTHPEPINDDIVGYAVMALAIVLTLALVAYQHHVVRKTRSLAIGADRMHYIGDVAVNIAVVVALLLQRMTGIEIFDPLFAVGIAFSLFVSAYRILKNALAALMDEELPAARRERIRNIVLQQPGVQGVHDMRTRTDGERLFIELHVEMDGCMPLREAHNLADKISTAIAAEIPNADTLIHQDPCGEDEFKLDHQIEGKPE